MLATQRRALITEKFERGLPAVELIEDVRDRVSDRHAPADGSTITVVSL